MADTNKPSRCFRKAWQLSRGGRNFSSRPAHFRLGRKVFCHNPDTFVGEFQRARMARFHYDDHDGKQRNAKKHTKRLCPLDHLQRFRECAIRELQCCVCCVAQTKFPESLIPVPKVYAHLAIYQDCVMTPRRNRDSAILSHETQASVN